MFWLFGYGSLLYRTDFTYIRSEIAELRGYSRRFWQGSSTDRGTVDEPGRVATLIEDTSSSCWGRAYEIADEHHEAVLKKLDEREREGGYSRLERPLYLRGGEQLTREALIYVAREGNPVWAGAATPVEIAALIRGKRGKSGANEAYVLDLAAALRAIEIHDAHVFELADHFADFVVPKEKTQ